MHALTILAFISLAVVVALLVLVLFEPPLRYCVTSPKIDLQSDDFIRLMSALADAPLYHARDVEMLSDGRVFYEAELREIAKAKRSVHIEAFIFHPSAIGDRFLAALEERARNGVAVKLVVDAIGSYPTPRKYFDRLCKAGGQVRWYQPLRFGTFKRMNNRTHRELIIIDGRVGFIGGAGIAGHWEVGDKSSLPWRDIMFRVEGGMAAGLQTTFAENWVESSGQILAVVDDFPAAPPEEKGSPGMVVISSPTAGRSTRNRVLFQTLIASATQVIRIHSPYFLPDHSASEELVRAAKERGVRVQIVVPGPPNNHPMTRLASRRRYGPLLAAGVEIYEYQPGMIHTKTMTVDGCWVVVGSTNFDSRSFDLNDEVNAAVVDRELVAKVDAEFAADLEKSKRIEFGAWKKRSLLERIMAQIGRIIERQE